MTYPTHGDNSGQDSSSGHSAQPDYGQGPYGQSQSQSQGSYGQDPYGEGAYGQGAYGQSSTGQYAYGQGGYGAQTPSYSGMGSMATGSPGGNPPPSNVGWAVAAIVFFWPLAFVAMTRALDVYPLWAAGRHAEAEAASATAKKFGTISLIVFVALIVLYFIFIFAMVGLAASTGY